MTDGARRVTTGISWGAALPQVVPDAGFDVGSFRAQLDLVDELGFDSVWCTEQVLGDEPSLGPLEAMTLAAATNERLRIGCAVLVFPLHSPVHLAKSLASIDQISRGRLEIGLGIGGTFRPLAAFGVAPGGLVTRFNEGVQLMKACWAEGPIDHEGRFWTLHGATMEPKPVQRPHPPIWYGGGHPDALRRAARHADGFFGAGSTTTEAFAAQVPIVRAALVDAGRDPGSFPIAKRVYVAVDDDNERARQRASAGLHLLYDSFGLPDLTPVAVYGTPDECVIGLQAVADAGAERILLHPFGDQAQQLERLGRDVIPHVRAAVDH